MQGGAWTVMETRGEPHDLRRILLIYALLMPLVDPYRPHTASSSAITVNPASHLRKLRSSPDRLLHPRPDLLYSSGLSSECEDV